MYLGRIDHQIKLNGLRIELGEIETALRSVEEVLEAVVVVRETAPGKKQLVAYLSPSHVKSESVLASCRLSLPIYMVPSIVIGVTAWPRTSSGKLDRKALPASVETEAGEEAYVAPRTPTEEMFVDIWETVLAGCAASRKLGVQSDFFALGGHSLHAVRIVSLA